MVKWAFDVFICRNNGKTRLYWRHKDGYRINIGEGGGGSVGVPKKTWQFAFIIGVKEAFHGSFFSYRKMALTLTPPPFLGWWWWIFGFMIIDGIHGSFRSLLIFSFSGSECAAQGKLDLILYLEETTKGEFFAQNLWCSLYISWTKGKQTSSRRKKKLMQTLWLKATAFVI